MNLFPYSAFKTVVEQKSFIKAAELLNVTPSAVSHSVSNLEGELGFPLFVRMKSKIELTDNGKKLLPSVLSVLNCEEKIRQEAALVRGLDQGKVRIGTFSSVCINYIPEIIKNYHDKYPKIQIIVYQGGYNDCFRWLKNGMVDAAFVPVPTKEAFYVKPLTKDRLLCVTPKGFHTKHRDFVTMEEIKNKTFVMQKGDYEKDTMGIIHKYGISVCAPFYSIDDASIAALIESGIGIGIMPELSLKKINNDIVTYPFNPPEFRIIGLAAPKKQTMSPATQKFLPLR